MFHVIPLIYFHSLWKLLQAECSQIARLCVPLLLHCVTLPSGMDQFWRCVEKDFHSDSWLDRFSAVEKVTMIGHFMEPATVRNSPLLQSSLANAFCYLSHSMDDINAAVAQLALLCLDTIKTVSSVVVSDAWVRRNDSRKHSDSFIVQLMMRNGETSYRTKLVSNRALMFPRMSYSSLNYRCP